MNIRNTLAASKHDETRVAAIVKIINDGIAAEHALPNDKLPDFTATVNRFLVSASIPTGDTPFVADDELARLGRMVSTTLSNHIQADLRKSVSLPTERESTDEQIRKYATSLQPFLLPIADARTVTLKVAIRQRLVPELNAVLSSKRDLLEKELAKIDLSAMSLTVLWHNDSDKNDIRGIVRSFLARSEGNAASHEIQSALERLSLAAVPSTSILAEASRDARLLQRLGSDAISAEAYKAMDGLHTTLAAARQELARIESSPGNLDLALRIDIDPEKGPLLNVRGRGRLELPVIPPAMLPSGFIDQSTVVDAGRLFGGRAEIETISQKLRSAASYAERVNSATHAIMDAANREISQTLRQNARRELLGGEFSTLGSQHKDIAKTLQEIQHAANPEELDGLVARLNRETDEALAPVEELARQANTLRDELHGWTSALKDDEAQLKTELEALLSKLEKVTTPEVLTVVNTLLKDKEALKRLDDARTANALKSVQSAFKKATATFRIDDKINIAIRDLKRLSITTSAELFDDPVVALSVAPNGKVNVAIDGLPPFPFDDPRLSEAVTELSQFKTQVASAIKSRKKEIESDITKVQSEIVNRANEIRTKAESELRNIGDLITDELRKLNLPDRLSLFGRELILVVDASRQRIEVKDGSDIVFAIKVTLDRPGQPPTFQFDVPNGGHLSERLLQVLDGELKELLGADSLTILNGRLKPDGLCVLTAKLQPEGFPIPFVVDLTIQFQLPSASNGWKPGIERAGVKTNAEAALVDAVDLFVKDLAQNSEALGIGPVRIDARPGAALHIGIAWNTKGSKVERLGVAYVNAADNLDHLAVLDRVSEPNGGLHDVVVEKLVKFWNSRAVMVPEADRDRIGDPKHYMELLLSGEWAKRGWRANPLGPFIKLE